MAPQSADIQKKRIISPTNFENKNPNLPDLLVDLQSIPEFLFLVGEIHIPSIIYPLAGLSEMKDLPQIFNRP